MLLQALPRLWPRGTCPSPHRSIPASQIKRARECEANTGTARRPDLAGAQQAGGGGGGGGEDAGGGGEAEVDPLDAFMAEIGQIEASEAAGGGKKPRQDRVEAEDNVEAFVEVGWSSGWS